jgi:CheY-like chemotaxis protein
MTTAETTPGFSNLNILVLDDDDSILMMMVAFLKKLGVENVVSFNHSLEAVKYIKTHTADIDLIFSDVEMPECDGLELCTHLAHMKYTNALIFITGASEVLKDCLWVLAVEQHRLNILEILSKPVSLPKIRQILTERF